MADIKENSSWADATNDWIRIHDLLLFLRKHYQVIYAENSRETFRKQAMHHFRNAAFIEDNGKATNSPNYRYRLTEEMLELIRSYGIDKWADKKEKFLAAHESLISMYQSKRSMLKMPVNINGNSFTFYPVNIMSFKRLLLRSSPQDLLRTLNAFM